MNIAFFIRHFTERGTEVSIYNYAKYNEEILKNKSYIICFNETKQKNIGFPSVRHSYNNFKTNFQIIEINDIDDMSDIIKTFNIHFFYTQTHGGGNDIYKFDNKQIWGKCKTIKHCVFYTTYPESDFYISISEMLNKKNYTNLGVIPYMVDLPKCDENLRIELKIPKEFKHMFKNLGLKKSVFKRPEIALGFFKHFIETLDNIDNKKREKNHSKNINSLEEK
jgi:hypothetical protein